MGKVRIIGGNWKGRKLNVLDRQGLRPTTDRIRETVFNWLQWHLPTRRCLDVFAGSGVLGIEAVSRGASFVQLIEKDRQIANSLRQQLQVLGSDKIELIQTDAIRFLQIPPSQPFDIVFIDPPFRQSLLEACCQSLEQNQWLSQYALIYIEMEQELDSVALPYNWNLIRDKIAGQVHYCLLERQIF
ncbi:16S rRNA (guanine(966)-N(2))-methyltransferase RsmD [Candidatus Albibeggiatoa sp. nov. BB20]|uniref:16S rRNA (guanine(966)-N(2))-methyltransferase RsmD n=1 Tax=Candidatus Albibeggiatoa sp. nov. BB20 TaxID=3162723 RepID=UPI0033655AF1